jgi:aminoglycoside phosphotransferase family enzyme/predicted kinase
MPVLDPLIRGLLRPQAYPHPVDGVEHIETHISHVLLAGDYAYKVKKPINLGFLDFSTLERRKFFCEEEIRLNGRLAPQIYLAVVPIVGTAAEPCIGGEDGTILEYAVKMRCFDQDALLTRRPVSAGLADRLAERVAAFHAEIPAAAADSPFGTPEAVLGPMVENFEQIRRRLSGPEELARLRRLEDWTRARHGVLRPVLEARRRQGHVRECHGDMHRGNIALVDGRLVIFDGIEFNPQLRWIDTMSEVAFLVMDLEEPGEAVPARRLLNRYLDSSGDYEGLRVLDFYKVYRAMVRAKVTAIRLGQSDVEPAEAVQDRAEYERYLALAEGYTQPRPRRLYLTHGVSGSGKSRLSAILRERLPLIHIRSDVERKRLFGLPPGVRTGSAVDAGLYSPDATARTYTRLLDLARLILDAGYSALVDATFLKAAQRRPFLALAHEKRCSCTIFEPVAPKEVLRSRVSARNAAGRDPSEADPAALEVQLAALEPLGPEERPLAVTVDTVRPPTLSAFLAGLPTD